MNIVHAPPPMYDEIDAAFHVKGKQGIIFTWGDTIYVPNGGNVTPALRAHEGVHFSRQTNDTPKIEAWWRAYIADPAFRLAEELPAHRAEFKQYRTLHRDPNMRVQYLYQVGARLSGPLYGGLITAAAARRSIAS